MLRVRLPHADWSDLVQNATMGLIEAVERYDPDFGVEFRSYARHRVRGSVFNGLKHMRSAAYSGESTTGSERVSSLSESEGSQDPTEAFVSLTIGLGIGFLLGADSMPHSETGDDGPYASAERGQVKAIAHEAVEKLPPRERDIVVLHYFQNLPFVEIAEMFGVSKGRVSQLHKQTILRLRGKLLIGREEIAC